MQVLVVRQIYLVPTPHYICSNRIRRTALGLCARSGGQGTTEHESGVVGLNWYV